MEESYTTCEVYIRSMSINKDGIAKPMGYRYNYSDKISDEQAKAIIDILKTGKE